MSPPRSRNCETFAIGIRASGHEAVAELSMGMSGDYDAAIEQGATLVRLGTAILGPRPPRQEAESA